MIYKGAINASGGIYNIKIIVPTNFPFMAPRVYLDMRVTVSAAQARSWLGDQNIILIPYLQQWRYDFNRPPTLGEMMQYVTAVFSS